MTCSDPNCPVCSGGASRHAILVSVTAELMTLMLQASLSAKFGRTAEPSRPLDAIIGLDLTERIRETPEFLPTVFAILLYLTPLRVWDEAETLFSRAHTQSLEERETPNATQVVADAINIVKQIRHIGSTYFDNPTTSHTLN